jgi:hypothetical protein
MPQTCTNKPCQPRVLADYPLYFIHQNASMTTCQQGPCPAQPVLGRRGQNLHGVRAWEAERGGWRSTPRPTHHLHHELIDVVQAWAGYGSHEGEGGGRPRAQPGHVLHTGAHPKNLYASHAQVQAGGYGRDQGIRAGGKHRRTRTHKPGRVPSPHTQPTRARTHAHTTPRPQRAH